MRQLSRYRAVPVMLLLFSVSFGLFLMHTLGHFGSEESMSSAHHGAAVTLIGHGHGEQPPAADDTSDAPAVPVGSIALCVAILCALLIVGLAAVIARRRATRSLTLDKVLRGVADAVRGPPKVPIGLVLADLSVLRN